MRQLSQLWNIFVFYNNVNTHTSNTNKLTYENNPPKIKQNNKNFFIIQKSNNWNYTIEVLIHPKEKINTWNLLNILKCFIYEKEFLCHTVAIGIKKNYGINIIEKKKSYILKKMDLHDFEKWLYETLFDNSLYNIEKNEVYCFYFLFSKQFIDAYNKANNSDILNLLYPTFQKKKNYNHDRIIKICKKYKFIRYLR